MYDMGSGHGFALDVGSVEQEGRTARISNAVLSPSASPALGTASRGPLCQCVCVCAEWMCRLGRIPRGWDGVMISVILPLPIL